jgi:hypothetical protein
MLTNSLNILIIVGAIALLALIFLLIRSLRQRVWIRASPNTYSGRTPIKIAYLHYEGNCAAKVSLIGSGGMPAMGHVDLDPGGDEASVYLLISGIAEDTGEPQYKEFGYIDADGLIYCKGEKRPIGYTARPSNPQTATIKAERKWYELWLFSHLNAYIGVPQKKAEDNNAEDKKKAKRRHAKAPEAILVGSAKMTGLRLNDRGYITSEAKAAAYSLFYSLHPRADYKEYFNPNAYTWKDTALIATVIYTILFLVGFIFHYYIDRLPLMRVSIFTPLRTIIYTLALIAAYYIIWAIVRTIKIEYIERSQSIQPKIDLFNKTLSIGKMDLYIVICAVTAVILTFFYYRTNFLPLAFAMIHGVLVNRFAFGSRSPWKIRTSFHDEEDDENDADSDKVENPSSDDENAIVVDYKWELGSITGKTLEGKLQLYFPNGYVDDLRRCNPFYMQKTDGTNKKIIQSMFTTLTEHPDFLARLEYVGQYIKTKAKESNLEIYDELQFALDFVQEPNITFRLDNLSSPINNLTRYIRFPDETLYDKEGDCDCKAFLAAMLFYVMGYDVLYLASREYQHAAIGIRVPENLKEFYNDEKVLAEKCVEFEGDQYIICETTGDEFKVGEFMHPMNMDDFEEKFTLTNSQRKQENSSTRIYNWQLDPAFNKELLGNLVMEFNERGIETLRSENPFDHYGEDGHTYEENVRYMFKYLTDKDNSYRLHKINTLADYIKEECKNAELDKYETLQFALDFVQEPNIKYCVDADSAGINYAKEYMRYPDETMYDKEGDCDCKSFLAAMLYHVMGYKVIFMMSNKLEHAAIAIECDESLMQKIPEENRSTTIREYNGTQYVFCETTGDGHRIGISQDTNIQDFETIVELTTA